MYGFQQQQQNLNGAYGAAAGDFGTFSGDGLDAVKASHPAAQKHRPRINVFAVLVCLLVPCGIFAANCASVSFLLASSPTLAYVILAVAFVFAAACTYLAVTTVTKKLNGTTVSDPYWYVFLAATAVVACFASVWLGLTNRDNNVMAYVDLQSLSARFDVNPAAAQGRQLMDVGRVVFSKGAHLDLTRAMGFRNVNNYCVAPIVSGNKTLESYDFWAIGLDCCRGNPADFRCGEYNNPSARAGLRVMRADQRAFYRLAVQQAEAAFGLKARHPLFFYWMEDPVAELESYMRDARQFFLLGTLSFCALQTLLVFVAVFIRTKF